MYVIEMTTEQDSAAGDGHAVRASETANPAQSPGAPLTIRIVDLPDRTARCTIYPQGLTGMARLETWLSADRSAFVDLEEWR